MTWRAALALVVAIGLVSACSAGSDAPSQPAEAHGSLSAEEYALAVTTAKQRQAEVTGTFIGATAVAGPDRHCPLHLRLVWKADANFDHAGIPGGPPDGPRKALLLTVDPATGRTCRTSAMYRNVGAEPGETLLYGRRP